MKRLSIQYSMLDLNLKLHLSRQTWAHPCHRPQNKVSFVVLAIGFLLTGRHHVYATGYSVSYRPNCFGDIHGVQYGRLDVTDEEVKAAAIKRAACMMPS